MKTTLIKILVLAITAAFLLAAPLPCNAAESDMQGFWDDDLPKSGGESRGHDDHEGKLTENMIKRIMAGMAEREPEKAEELKQLQKNNPEKFQEEIRKIMRRHARGKQARRMEGQDNKQHQKPMKGDGSQAQRGQKQRPQQGEHQPSGMRRGMEQGMGPEMMMGHPGGDRRGLSRQMHDEYLEWLEENYPEKAKKLAKLKDEKPELYRKMLQADLEKYGEIAKLSKEHPEMAKILKEDLALKDKRDTLLRKIKTAANESEKTQLFKELQTVLSGRFDLIVQRKQIEYDLLHKRLEKMQKRVAQSQAQIEKWKDNEFKSSNINARMEELVGKVEQFKWE